MELSRRDDLESLFYMLVYFALGSLDWQQLPIEQSEHIKALKMKITKNPQVSPKLIEYINYVRELEFEEQPDYEYLIHLLDIR